ncbi:hypothetical protein JAAARDRAFT_401934 [Jaapia argillacea MUCL 33604]|uniref:Uncharacterized protein n=1 Tax=Jaapia argillacea MUCL 33604 TaxID=933084 RepID=A0A067PTT4_9AGAM|nr:hypothetical protein JAAARDRAFT_401934 [Jaapia argillacea MUCL 33604]
MDSDSAGEADSDDVEYLGKRRILENMKRSRRSSSPLRRTHHRVPSGRRVERDEPIAGPSNSGNSKRSHLPSVRSIKSEHVTTKLSGRAMDLAKKQNTSRSGPSNECLKLIEDQIADVVKEEKRLAYEMGVVAGKKDVLLGLRKNVQAIDVIEIDSD